MTVRDDSATWVTGSVWCDLTDVPEDKARAAVHWCLHEAPTGARVVLHVGPLPVNFAVLPAIWEHGRRVTIEVSGHGAAVARWVEALRGGPGAVL